MRRRDFLAGLVGTVTTAQFWKATAQSSKKPANIGFLGLGSSAIAEKRIDALRSGLNDLGFVEKRDYLIELRSVDGDYSRLSTAAAELMELAPSVLVTQGTPGTAALKKATKVVPIVMVSGDALATGLIESLNRPGVNVTGLTFFSPELMAKRLELLKEALPQIEDVGVLANSNNPVTSSLLDALSTTGRSIKVRLHPVLVRSENDIDRAFSQFAENNVGGVIIQDEPMIIANASRIAALAAERRLLTVGFKELVEQGGVVSYGIDFTELYRKAGQYVAMILNGAKPEDLPVERPSTFHLVVNSKAAKALGIKLPPLLLARADEVIE